MHEAIKVKFYGTSSVKLLKANREQNFALIKV